MPQRLIKSVTISFPDGTTETYEIPSEQGFIRESFTLEPKPGEHSGLSKWGTKLKTFNIFWTEVE